MFTNIIENNFREWDLHKADCLIISPVVDLISFECRLKSSCYDSEF